jgi:hypothetical protein
MTVKRAASVAEELFKGLVIGLFGSAFEAALMIPMATFTGVVVLDMLLERPTSTVDAPTKPVTLTSNVAVVEPSQQARHSAAA